MIVVSAILLTILVNLVPIASKTGMTQHKFTYTDKAATFLQLGCFEHIIQYYYCI